MPLTEPGTVDGLRRTDGVAENAERTSAAQSCQSTRVIIKDRLQLQLLRETRLRSGLWLSVMDLKPEEGIRFQYEKKNPLIDFGFVLAGDMRNNIQSSATAQIEVNNRPGRGGVAFLPESEGIVEIPGQQKMQILHVHVEPQVLHSLLEGELDVIPAELKSVVEGGETRGYFCHGEMDPAVQTVAYQIFYGPLPGTPERLFLEGKALEFIALQMAWIVSQKGRQSNQPVLSPKERDRIHAAREILVQNLTSPPTLLELSRRVGLSVNKLGAGFRQMFGTTVYGFLKEYQMQKARLLFEEADLNVSQVAWAVGYVNVSHFSAAYKKRFGVQPKSFLKSARRKTFLA
jgi:AraC family transcriptional activator of pyochelin receptor